ncbi:ATP-binding protein [Bifidobacterium vespertilionis]|uniref:ATP-binding protein n=1 Tax=Bifidobacterium vespertilionis TaxID=2562524 RepID=UPI001BDCEAB7|nr:AAA family ATPase [Bifidobacterium vespertilionis]MBT1180201.1 ATP-binding protein [Bifidobacterium vespertilionis]
MLERKAYRQLLDWKRLKTRQGLLITGARQVGKTTLVEHFGADHYRNTAEINFIETPHAVDTVASATDTDDLLLRLSVLANARITPGDTLLFLDEIQACQDTLTWTKFLAGAKGLDVIVSGSLLGIDAFNVRSIPVGFLQTIRMYPMDFHEFCLACGLPQPALDALDECFIQRREVPDYLHSKLTDLWYKYLLVGGMPDAVQAFVDSHDIIKVRNTQQAIFDTYEYDITKYVTDLVDRRHIKSIYEAIPSQLNAENKRFKFTKLGGNVRFAHMRTAFDWLANAGIALPTSKVQDPEYPLAEHAEENAFKLYMNDVGLLTSRLMRGVDLEIINHRSSMNYGSIFENASAQELFAQGFDLHYYNRNRIGEVDFVLQHGLDSVSLAEIKSGKDYTRHRAMNNLLATNNYRFADAYVFHDGNTQTDEGPNGMRITYLPIYTIGCLNPAQ